METRQLGRSDLQITRIGLGAWAIGGEWLFGWGPQDDAESIAVIRHAVERGLNWIDTAPAYGLGHSESIVGRAVEEMPAGDRPYLFTKCSLVWDETRTVIHNLRPDSIRREVEGSLARLRVERIDLYQIHWPRWPSSPAGHDPGSYEDAWRTLAELQQEGKLRWIGVSNFDAEQLARVEAIARVTSVQPPYSAIRRDIETTLLPYCLSHNIGVVVYSPMQSGLLSGKMSRERLASLPTGDWRRRAKWFQEPILTQALNLVDILRDIGEHEGRSAAEIAVAWALHHPAVTGAIVGARRPEQVDGFIGAADVRLSDADLTRIDDTASTKASAVSP
jgi:aryl-alcohol dehydrogenase-like predicted oxidoreductase